VQCPIIRIIVASLLELMTLQNKQGVPLAYITDPSESTYQSDTEGFILSYT